MRAAAALVLLLLAGCSAPAGDVVPAPVERVSYLHSAMTLADAPEANETTLRFGSFFEAWAAGAEHPAWLADPVGSDAYVTRATATLYVRASGPVLETRRFPDLLVYAGADDAWMGLGAATHLVALEPGRIHRVEVEIELPERGLWLAPDAGFGLKIVPVMTQQDERAGIEVLLGGNDTASRVAWRVEPSAAPPATRDVRRDEASGSVGGTIYLPAGAPSTATRAAVEVPPEATFVLAWLNATGGVGVPDLDLALLAPNGDEVAASGTPEPRDAIRAGRANLRGGGEYELVVSAAASARATYRLEWLVGTA